MPVITFEYDDLKDLGINIEKEKLINTLPMIGSDIEDYNDKEIKVEFFPNRPDNLSVEGVARSLKGFLSQETGLPQYNVESSGEKVYISKEVEKIRPYIAFAKIENVDFSGNKIKYIMDFQENLHWVIGRDRKKVAIGVHNADVISGDYKYIATEKDENPFIPLEMDRKLKPGEIFTEHETGKKYAHLLEDFDKYPLILDSEDRILSMPPIINGELTKLTEDTHTIIVDVTGTDKKAVEDSLNILVSSFAEVGGQIKSMEMVYEDQSFTTPNLSPKEKLVNVDLCNELIGGTSLNSEDVKLLLEKARFDAEIISPNELKVKIPPFRCDILHEVDIVENVAIQYCINKIPSKLPEISTVAYEHDWFKGEKTIRELMVGLGFNEVMSLMLTSEESHYKKMLQKETEHVQVSKPISVEGTMIRTSLLNNLLEFLDDNKAEDLPQKIFEIGDVLYIDESTQFNVRTGKKLAGAVCHSNANFTEMKSIVSNVLSNLGYTMEVFDSDNPSFIQGRVANIKGNSKNGNIEGFFGEVSPEVITNFDIEYPIIMFEIEFLRD